MFFKINHAFKLVLAAVDAVFVSPETKAGLALTLWLLANGVLILHNA